MPTGADPRSTRYNTDSQIELQRQDGRATDVGLSVNAQSTFDPAEVSVPVIVPRVEESNHRLRFGIARPIAIALSSVAQGTSQPKVGPNRLAAA